MTKNKKTKRADGTLTSMAGEFLVAGKLLKRGLLVSVTMGNAKAIDLFVHNPKTDKTFTVQVKALRAKNWFPIHKEKVSPNHIYIFVILNHNEQEEEYFIVPGNTILDDINRFFRSSYSREKPSTFPGIWHSSLKEFKNNWSLFESV